MTRQDYIAGLEEIGKAFGSVDLTDATNMESDRHKKMKKLVADLCDRLYEDIAISAKVAADNAEAGIGEQGDLFEEAEKAAKAKAAKPAKEAEVVDVQTFENKPLALPAPDTEKKTGKGKKSGGKGKKPGKKGGAK